MQPVSQFRRTTLLSALLAAVTLAIFWPLLHNGFVNYDDTVYVTENPQVLAGLTPAGAAWAFREAHFANWHPLTWLSHMLDVQLFGPQPGAHHLVSLLFHVANTVLLFLLMQRMTAQSWASAMVAALFAWHPLHVESVAWISERKDVLSTFFALLCLFTYVRHVERVGKGATMPRFSISYFLALLFFALGLMSKAMVVTLPGVMLLLDYWPMRRFPFDSPGPKLRRALPLIMEKIPFFVLAVAATAAAIWFLKESGVTSDAPNVSLGERLARVVASYEHYIGKMFWPSGLIIPFLRPSHWSSWSITIAATTVFGVTLIALWWCVRRPSLAVGWFWFVGTLLPVVGTVPVGAHLFADRYTYFPLIGLFIALVWGVLDLTGGWKHRAPILGTAAGLVLAACAAASNVQARYWQDSEQLYTHTLTIMPGNYVARNGLGLYYLSQHRVDDAIVEYREALQSNPAYDDAYSNLGRALAEQRKYPEAAESFEAALRLRPNDIKTLNNFGNVLIFEGRYSDASEQFKKVLRSQPDNFNAHNNLAVCCKKLGRTDLAIAEYREAIRLQPAFLEALNNLALILATDPDQRFRNGAEAVELATRACEMTAYQNPTLLAALAAAYAEIGRFSDAASLAQQAQSMIEPQSALASRLTAMLKNFKEGKAYRGD